MNEQLSFDFGQANLRLVVNNERQVVTTSRKLADYLGWKHDRVVETIRKLVDPQDVLSPFVNAEGQSAIGLTFAGIFSFAFGIDGDSEKTMRLNSWAFQAYIDIVPKHVRMRVLEKVFGAPIRVIPWNN
jgi:phage regulator Rha-like protein